MSITYMDITNKEVAIRDLLSAFPDTSTFSTICELLSEQVEVLSTDWSTTGSTQHIANLRSAIEELETTIGDLTNCANELKGSTVDVTGYEPITESQNYY